MDVTVSDNTKWKIIGVRKENDNETCWSGTDVGSISQGK